MSNLVAQSRYREQIDTFLEQGRSTREISRWLAEQDPPERISHTAIHRYSRDRVAVIRERLAEEVSIQRAVEQRLTGIQVVDQILDRLAPVVELGIRRASQTARGEEGLSVRETSMLGKLLVDLHRLRGDLSGESAGAQGALTFEDAVRLIAEGGGGEFPQPTEPSGD